MFKNRILILFLCLTLLISGKKDPRSEENLRKRVENYVKYLNYCKFDKALNMWCKEERPATKEDRKYEIKSWRRERWSVAIIKQRIESIRIKGDKGFVFLECRDQTIFGKVKNKWREMEIWIFEDNNWFIKDIIPIGDNICKDPIIIYNIFIEEITPETFTVSWETDEEAQCEVEYEYTVWGKGWMDIDVRECILDPMYKRAHRIILKRMPKEEWVKIKIWARKGERACHSLEYSFKLEEIISSKEIPKRLE